jgi:hypothetical protein
MFRTVIRMSSEQQQSQKELWKGLPAMRRFWRKRSLWLARLQCLIQILCRDSCITTGTVGHWGLDYTLTEAKVSPARQLQYWQLDPGQCALETRA